MTARRPEPEPASPAPVSRPASSPRYAHIRTLGRGAMGEVDLVHDDRLASDVARKRLRRAEAELAVRFKREFRALERLEHPSLVRLFELGDDDGLYFTMEAALGPDLASFSGGAGPEEGAARLATVLPAIVDGLAYLHAQGIVHRDLKPGHVIVVAPGCVKLLDFGVLAELRSGGEPVSVAGTPAYMAPEQLAGARATPAVDAWALGVTLVESLSGEAPFGEDRAEVAVRHGTLDDRTLEAIADDVPVEIRALVRGLLRVAPEDRWSMPRAQAWLHDAASSRHGSAPPKNPPFVGRRPLVEALCAAVLATEARTRVIVLRGPSGAGKSSVLDATREALPPGTLVLAAHTRPHEQIAFNALDGILDALADALRALPPGAVPERALGLAAAAFPALAVSEAARRDRTRRLVSARLFGHDTTATVRRESFDALAQVLAATSASALLVVDDLQWADDDSLALLSHLLEGGGVKVLAALRDDVPAPRIAAWLGAREDVDVRQLPSLSTDELAVIAREAARAQGAHPTDAETAALVGQCDGRPFLAEVLGRSLATARGQAERPLESDIEALESPRRALLLVLSIAEEWVAEEELATFLDQAPRTILEHVLWLERRGLARRAWPSPRAWLADVYHDGVRTAALAVADATEVARLHGLLADRLARVASVAPQRVVRHLLAAGRAPEARPYAEAAARVATEGKAYGLAARMLGIALASAPPPEADRLREARAQMLERAGQYQEAAEEWRVLAGIARADADRRLDRALGEAHAHMAAGDAALGLRRLDETLASLGEPTTDPGGVAPLLAAARFLLGPGGAAVSDRVPTPEAVRRAERDVKIGKLLCFFDPLPGLRFLVRARARFAEMGAHHQVAVSDYTFAVLALIGSRKPDVPLANRYVRAADARADDDPPAEVTGTATFVQGLAALRAGRWDASADAFDRAMRIFEGARGTTELMMAASWRTMPDVYRQDGHAIRRHLAWFDRRREEVGETFIVAHVELLRGYESLLAGSFDLAFARIDGIVGRFRTDRGNAQTAAALLYRHLASTYGADVVRARDDYLEHLRAARRFRFFDTMYAGPLASVGALLEAAALRLGDRAASPGRLERFARMIDDGPPLAAGVSWRARAYAADARGDRSACLRLLELGEIVADRHQRAVDAAIARYQLGVRIGGERGAALVTRARGDVSRAGASERLLHEDPVLRAGP